MTLELIKNAKTGFTGGTNLMGNSLTTVVSYPDRDPDGKTYGDPGWRGNCSGLLVRDLLTWYWQNHFKSRQIRVADPMSGSGTTYDVCQDLGLECDAYDLNPSPRRGVGGWNARTDEFGRAVDFVFVHPPYWDVVRYSATQWKNRKPDPNDLSEIAQWPDFVQALNECHLRMFSDIRPGGLMAVLVGDVKKRGTLYSMQRDMAWFGTPKQVIVKTQHNCWSDKQIYSGSRFIPITHEYVLVFERQPGMLTSIKRSVTVDYDLRKWESATWKSLVRGTLDKLGKKATLASMYAELQHTAKAAKNANWQARVRATLQECPDFAPAPSGSGTWRLVA